MSLSLRYGIATPYTSFLVEEPQEVTVEREVIIREVPVTVEVEKGVEVEKEVVVEKQVVETVVVEKEVVVEKQVVQTVVVEKEVLVERAVEAPVPAPSGAEAVADAEAREELRSAERAPVEEAKAVRHVGEHTFVYRSGIWVDTAFDADKMQPTEVAFGSSRYFELAADPEVAGYLALGNRVIWVADGVAYEVKEGEVAEAPPAAAAKPVPAKEPTPSAAAPTAKAAPVGFWAGVWALMTGKVVLLVSGLALIVAGGLGALVARRRRRP